MLLQTLNAIGKLLDRLSVSRLLLAFTLAILSITTIAVFENRDRIYEKVFSPGRLTNQGLEELSPESKARIDDLLTKYPDIALLSVLKFDFIAGTRVPIYRGYNDPDIARVMGARIARSKPDYDPGTVQLFTADPETNREVVSVLNGEFTCASPRENSGILLAWPEMRGKIVTSCRIPIPPATSYGAPRGYIAIHFTKPVDSARADGMTKDLLSLAMFIYLNDVRGITHFTEIPRN